MVSRRVALEGCRVLIAKWMARMRGPWIERGNVALRGREERKWGCRTCLGGVSWRMLELTSWAVAAHAGLSVWEGYCARNMEGSRTEAGDDFPDHSVVGVSHPIASTTSDT